MKHLAINLPVSRHPLEQKNRGTEEQKNRRTVEVTG